MTEYPVYEYSPDTENPGMSPEMTQALYDLLFRYADTFSLSRPGYHNQLPDSMKPKKTPFRDVLRPYIVKKFHADGWYGWADGWYGWPESETGVFLYRCCEETRKILSDHVPTLFIQPAAHRVYGLVYPEFEDLCFYRKGKMIFGSLSHEYMCTVYPPEDTDFPADSPDLPGTWKRAVSFTRYDIPG